MGTTASAERRDPSAPRRTIKTTVDLTPGDERDSWQADAVEVSPHGMSMRASVLPEVGEALGVRFKPEGAGSVAAQAEVVWASDQGAHAGTFGVRFTEVSPQAERSLRRMLDAKDDVMAREGDRPAPPPADARVKLFIHGMDAPLRAKVRASDASEVIVGSELSFLKLGDKVDVDGAGAKVTGAIVKVDVEVDPKTRVPRLVLTIDLGGKRKIDLGTAPTVPAESPRASDPPELPPLKPVAKPIKTAVVHDDAPAERPAPRRAAHATNVLGADDVPEGVPAERSQPESELSLIEPPPGWITQGMRAVRHVGEKAAPVMRRAAGAVGELAQRIRDRKAKGAAHDDEESTGEAPRRGLRPQHKASTASTASTSADGDAVATQPGRTRKVGMYAVVGLIVAAGIVAYASTSGPKVETPRPQVAVAAEGTVDPNAAPADPNAAPTDPNAAGGDPNAMTVEATPGAQQADPRWVNGRNPRTADLAAAAGSQGDMEAPVIQQPAQRGQRPMAQRQLMQPGFAQQRVVMPPAVAQRQVMAQRPAAQPAVAQRPVAVAPVAMQGPARPAVFGNPAVRSGTVLRLRMDGPIGAISGVGARGAAIVMTLPGRHSLDMAAPLAQVDPRIAGAGVMNRATGAELTLRFREPAPPFVARSRGNVLEIVLAPTPGQPVRAGLRAPLVIAPRR